MIGEIKIPRSAIPVLLIVLGPMVMLHTLWTNPTSAGEDDVTYYYPLRTMVGQALSEGRWPLDNPHEATGMPLMADPQSAVMYPPTWLFAAIAPKIAYSLTLFLAFSVAGGGAYLYLRRLGLIRSAACFGAMAFTYCGFLVGHRVHWSILHAGAYLPWGLWCIEGLRRRPLAAAAWIVPIAYLALVAGHWPTFIHVSLIWAVYLLLRGRPLGRSVGLAALGAALAIALAAPQIEATSQLLAQATRSRIGYAMAGENSFFPASAVLALYPMLLGCRTPNFFPADWWGPWHLCETLGYVGLVTMVLAGAAMLKLYRKRKGAAEPDTHPQIADDGEQTEGLQALVRAWAWMAIGAGIWMLGYYLPTYRLIHMLPILGVIRCPARMVLAVDMALATLAGIAIHVVAVGGKDGRAESLRRWIGWGAFWGLAGAMLGALIIVAVAGGLSVAFFEGEMLFFSAGGAGWRALKAVLPINPAVWVQWVLVAATLVVVRKWLAAPRRRAGMLVALVLVDLFFITHFVDVPANSAVAPDPEVSRAAEWLAEKELGRGDYLVWGIGRTYHDRAAELLRPKTSHSLGISTINTYGPFQSPAHSHLLGFRIFGTNRDWERLVRRNELLSLYGVKYILTPAEGRVYETLESVRVPTGPTGPDGANLLTDQWRLDLAEYEKGVLRLRTPVLWKWSIAQQTVTVTPGTVYRISLDARGPVDGAANFLRADFHKEGWGLDYETSDAMALNAHAEQIGPEWRHFEWTFSMPASVPPELTFRIFTMSERPIEVRRVSFRASHLDVPIGVGGRIPPGRRIYGLVATLSPTSPGDSPIAVFENLLVLPPSQRPVQWRLSPDRVERFKWEARDGDSSALPERVPQLGLQVRVDPGRMLLTATLPAGLIWLALVGVSILSGRFRQGS